MKTSKHTIKNHVLTLLAGWILATLAATSSHGQTVLVSDNFTAANVNSGFALGEGANSAIFPPFSNRITGTVASDLRYLKTGGARSDSLYTIGANRLRVGTQTTVGRFSISGNGVNPFNFASALGTAGATPADPAIYEVKISMRNEASSTARLSFGLATSEGDVGVWDFGVQINHVAAADTFYTVHRRIDDASSGVGDLNTAITTTAPDTWQTMVSFLIRVTDAGAESGADYNSRVQVSMDNGDTWIYDTSTDVALPNGFRFDAPGRVFVWDQASNGSGVCFYDSFSVTSIHAPPPPPERVWTGAGTDDNWSTGANWGGTAPNSGEPLLFGLSARQVNYNDIAGLTTPTLSFTNGGFVLDGSPLSIEAGINNLAGSNTINLPLDWPLTGGKNWQLAAGTELHLPGYSTWTTVGDHIISGGGTLRLSGALSINNNPALILTEGRFVVDGGSYNSLGGFRIGSSASASAPVETVLVNGASLTLSTSAANLRVGDGAALVPNRLIVNSSTITMFGGALGIPYAAGCTGEVVQTGGWVKDCYIVFSDNGAGVGSYAVTNGIVEPYQIRRDIAGGTAIMRFNNAQLRPAIGANTANFMSGLDEAEIQFGGLTIDATADITMAQALSGAGSLTKINSAAVTLTGANSYTGNTVVQEGKLVLPTTQTNAASVQVAAGAELGVIRTAAEASLTAGSLSLGNSTLSFDLGAFSNPTAPLVTVNTLTASGGAGSVLIHITGGFDLTVGQFPLVDYAGAIGGGGFNAFTIGSLPAGVSATLVNNTGNSSIDLNITAAPGLRWTGANGNSWDYGTLNWYDEGASANATYSDGQPTRFFDGAATGWVELTSNFTPGTLTISNQSLPYVFGGFGSLNVARLIKHGTGSLTRVDGGADVIPELEINQGSFVSSNTYEATLTSVLTDNSEGLGTFAKSGTGALTISSANSGFDGTILVREGVLKAGNTAALGTTNGSTVVTNGGTLDVNDLIFPHEPVIVSGSGHEGVGAIIDSTTAGDVAHNLTDVTLAGDTTLGAPNGGRWDIRVRSSTGPGPGLRGNGFNLTKVGSGMVSIACQRNLGAAAPYWDMNLGNVTVEAGTLAFAESLSFGNPDKLITVQPGAVLQLFDLGITNPILRTITMTEARLNASGNATDTNVLSGGILLSGANTIWANQAHLIVNGSIAGSGTISFFANVPGTLILNGANTHDGTLTVTNGTVGGYGSLAGSLVMLGGTLVPGWPDLGTLTANGNVTLGGTTVMEIDRAQSPNSDQVAAGGALAFGGNLQVVLATGAAAPQAGDVYQLFNKGGSGGFDSITLPDLSALPGGLSWNTDALLTAGYISVVGAAVPPAIQPPYISGGHLILAGDGGVANGSYAVLTSTNVAAAANEWVANTTGTFSASGAFSNAIPINPADAQRYFRIKQP